MQPTTQGRDAEKNLPNAFSNTFHATEMPQELQLHHVTPKGSWKQHEKASHSMLAATFCSVPSPAIFWHPTGPPWLVQPTWQRASNPNPASMLQYAGITICRFTMIY
jgi:hypothetical protein